MKKALAAVMLASALTAFAGLPGAQAATPKDMFVMATLLDEFTSLDPGEIYVMRHDSPGAEQKWRNMSIAAMGRSVTAQQVIYLSILSIDLEHSPGSNAVRGHGEVTVRVVDTESGKNLWPVDASDGYALSAETRMYHEGETDADIRDTLHKIMADKIVKLFTGYRTD